MIKDGSTCQVGGTSRTESFAIRKTPVHDASSSIEFPLPHLVSLSPESSQSFAPFYPSEPTIPPLRHQHPSSPPPPHHPPHSTRAPSPTCSTPPA